MPPPTGDPDAPLKALIFDSHYDPFRGTIIYFRVFQGRVKPKDLITFMSNNAVYKIEEVGMFQIDRIKQREISAGQVGYLIAGIKTVSDTRCGDTITLKEQPCDRAMPGFKEAKPVVFSSIYPVATDGYEELAVGLEKLKETRFIFNEMDLHYERKIKAALDPDEILNPGKMIPESISA